MDRRHLRAEKGVILHLIGKLHAVDIARNRGRAVACLLSDLDRRDEGADTDPCRTEVADLVDL